jgi:transketolase
MQYLSSEEVLALERKANLIRQSVIEMLTEAGSGHTAGPLGMADVFHLAVLRRNETRSGETRLGRARSAHSFQRAHLSNSVCNPRARGLFFRGRIIDTLRKLGSRLQGHPHKGALPGIETSSGPLGSGLSQAIGMALAERIDNPYSAKFFYCLTGDGELNEGQVWEALMQAGKEKLHNLIMIVDRNGIQIDGYTKDVMPLEPLAEKFESFNFDVQEVDGHNIRAVNDAIGKAQAVYGQPSVIIAHTIPSKGVDVFERDFRWHGNPPGKGPEDRVEKKSAGGSRSPETPHLSRYYPSSRY